MELGKCPLCMGSGKDYKNVIGFAYDVVQITLDEYRDNKNKIDNLIDLKCELMKKSLKQRIKDDGEEYYNKQMSRINSELIDEV